MNNFNVLAKTHKFIYAKQQLTLIYCHKVLVLSSLLLEYNYV